MGNKILLEEGSRLRERGYSYKKIAKNFNDRGIRSRRNKEYYKNLLVTFFS
ncbi:MAG: recombinase family protein [Alphaproteobacteria bacterium]